MSSDEGYLIKEKLEKELNESELGPYQSALYSLKDLIEQYPHAWPIYVMGQRILDDRAGYEQRRVNQEKQMKAFREKIERMKKIGNSNTQRVKNS